jgi:hypothetical protein
MTQQCFFCNNTVQPVHVHGHYQCPVCNTNILPCCDGDNCDTNQLLQPTITDIAMQATTDSSFISKDGNVDC